MRFLILEFNEVVLDGSSRYNGRIGGFTGIGRDRDYG